MKKILSFLAIMLLIGFFIGVLTNLMPLRADEEDKEYKLPDINLENITGETYNLAETDELTILFFWLAESDSCLLQLKRLNNFIAEDKDINILAITIGAVKEEKLLDLKSDLNLEFPLLIDQRAELAKSFEITTIPITIIYNPQVDDLKTILGTFEKDDLNKKIKPLAKKDSKSIN